MVVVVYVVVVAVYVMRMYTWLVDLLNFFSI